MGKRGERFLRLVSLLGFTLLFSLPFFLVFLKFFINGRCVSWLCVSGLFFSFFLVFLGGGVFIVKFPVFLFHMWLPRAHVEAPTVGSVILAACLLKLGSYGFARFFAFFFSGFGFFFVLGCVGMLFASLCCLFSCDLKALVAYSSVFHIRAVFRGFMLHSEVSFLSSVSLRCAHGFVSALFFFVVGCCYDVKGARSFLIFGAGGLSGFTFWLLVVFLNSGLPISLPFFSEVFLFSQQVSFFFPSFFLSFVSQFFGGLFGMLLLFFSGVKLFA
ncbi:MAG: NADH-ubiquinone oxidoreductase chain 4 [Ignavibacteria bacterium]|nr:MAG: NADH-ubiquinone oxidoreductase chain 4 [Ignavibacteria bacterium]